MNVEVNWLAVLLATLSSMVVGSVWYAPPVFGKKWMKMIGKTPKDMEKGGWTPILIAILASAVTAYVLAYMIYMSNSFFGNSFLRDAVTTALWVWLGFTAVRFWTHDSFEGRPRKLTLMNVLHELVTLLAMGLIIGIVGVSGEARAAYHKCNDTPEALASMCLYDNNGDGKFDEKDY